MADNLKQKTIRGVVWSGIHKFAIVLLNFISGIVLARLLTPHDYGVIGMLTIFLAISNTFIDGGFGSALIQKKRPTNEDYSTILYWNLGLSVVLYGVLFVCAPLIARFYDLPLLIDVLRIQGFVLIINAARIVQRNQLRKQLKFKKIAIINLTSNVVALVVTIILAWKGFGVWALVAQQLLLAFLTTSLYWITSRWRPMLIFSVTSFKELFGFGGFILLSNLLNSFCNNIQGLLIGKVYNSSTLGYYTKAHRTESLASTFVSSVLDQVSYPVLAEAQDDKVRLISILKRFICSSAYLTFPLMLLLFLLAKPLFLLLYSDRWLGSVPYFQILCFGGIAICLQAINYYAVAAIGNSKQLFKWTIIKRVLGLVLVIFGLWAFDIYGLLFASVLSAWIIYVINAFLVSKFIGYTCWHQFLDLLPILLCSSAALFVAFFAGQLAKSSICLSSIVTAIVYISVYFTISYLFKMESYAFTKDIFSSLMSKIRKRR